MDWTPPPEPIAWVLPKPLAFGSASYPSITVRSPSAGDILKANAMPGQSGLGFTLRLIAELSLEGIPYEALAQAGPNGVPQYIIEQITAYLDLFGGAPVPGPLEQWRAELTAKMQAEADAKAAAVQASGTSETAPAA